MGLKKYRAMRKFAHTPEPKGGKKTGKIHHFVVQKHKARRLHYDFRLEIAGVLKSWAVPKGPPLKPHEKHLAVHVEDHPLDYRNFEGTIPKGHYGAGSVEIWDEGNFTVIGAESEADIDRAFNKKYKHGEVMVILNGKKLQGEYVLVKMEGRDIKNGWLMMKRSAEVSVVPSKDQMEEQGVRRAMPTKVKPMLAKVAEKPFSKDGWVFEVKWDGYRAISEVKKGKVKLYSRNFQPFEKKFAPIVADLKKLGHDAVLDGEVVVLDEHGRSGFQLLQDYQETGRGDLVYQVFDLLYLDGRDLRELPLVERKKMLELMLEETKHVRYSSHVEKNGMAFFKSAKKAGLEGVMAKKADGSYYSGERTDDWLKVKSIAEQEAVIVGYTEPRGTRKHIGALILGVYREGKLQYIGHAGGGSQEGRLGQLREKLEKIEQKSSAFENPPTPNAPVHWVKPKFVAQVKFQEWTKDGIMRQPIYLGLREDKNAEDVGDDKLKIKPGTGPGKIKKLKSTEDEVTLTNEDKVLFPKERITKGDIAEYYGKIAKYILPYMKNRPVSLHRFPNGIKEEGFYQKHVDTAPKFVKTVPITSESDGEKVNYLICNDEKTLQYLVQLASFEMNVWNSQLKKLHHPDYVIFDLDPEGVSFDGVIKTAQMVKKVLDEIGAKSYCKTSGAHGLHIYVPLAAKYTFEQARLFAELVAHLVQNRLPKIASAKRGVKRRVHVDYPQNRLGATTVIAYSVRPQPGATVSTPLLWSEVKTGLNPKKFTIETLPARLKKVGDLWKPVLGPGVDLKKCLQKIEKITK